MEIIDGRKISEKIKNKLAKEVFQLIKDGYRQPNLAIILVGDREDSKLYVSLKEKVAKEVGIDTSLYLITENDSEDSVIETINFLNNDVQVDGILIQLPLPKKFNTDKILSIIDPEKDVDGFNLNSKLFSSPVLLAIKNSLNETKIDLKNKNIFLFYNSEIFKEEVEHFFAKQNLTFNSVSSKELDQAIAGESLETLKKEVRKNNILISAIGRAEFIDKSFLEDEMILLDVGINKKDGKVCGDINFFDTKSINGWVTPVPGGIGPMTVASLLSNVLEAYLLKIKK